MKCVVLPHLSHIDADTDVEVCKRAVQLLLHTAATCQSSWCMDLLDIISKVSSLYSWLLVVVSRNGLAGSRTLMILFLNKIIIAIIAYIGTCPTLQVFLSDLVRRR